MIKCSLKTLTSAICLLGLAACAQDPNVSNSSEQQDTVPQDTPRETIDGKFTPPDGKVLMFIGQDSDTITAYVNEVPEDNIEGITLYSQVKNANPDLTLKAMFKTANWNSGDVDFVKSLNESPKAALAIGLAFDKCNQEPHGPNIAAGKYDKTIDTMAQHFKSLAPRKIFLRIGYEFDGPWNCYEPESYKAAFRHMTFKLREAGADNVTTVWQSAVWPDPTIAGPSTPLYDHRREDFLDMWYPGDDVVDWVSISVFYRDLSQWNYTPPDTPDRAQEAFLTFARKHNKPVMIAESAPQGYRTGVATYSPIQTNAQEPSSPEKIWQDWYVPYFDFIKANKDVIRAVAYINTHWEAQGMWVCEPNGSPGTPNCPQGNWGDSRVQAQPYIKENWLKEVNNSDLWIQTSQY